MRSSAPKRTRFLGFNVNRYGSYPMAWQTIEDAQKKQHPVGCCLRGNLTLCTPQLVSDPVASIETRPDRQNKTELLHKNPFTFENEMQFSERALPYRRNAETILPKSRRTPHCSTNTPHNAFVGHSGTKDKLGCAWPRDCCGQCTGPM